VVLSNIDTIPHLLISDSFVSAAMIGHSHKFYTEVCDIVYCFTNLSFLFFIIKLLCLSFIQELR